MIHSACMNQIRRISIQYICNAIQMHTGRTMKCTDIQLNICINLSNIWITIFNMNICCQNAVFN